MSTESSLKVTAMHCESQSNRKQAGEETLHIAYIYTLTKDMSRELYCIYIIQDHKKLSTTFPLRIFILNILLVQPIGLILGQLTSTGCIFQ